METSGQNFQQMPHWMQSVRSITGRRFRQAPVCCRAWSPGTSGPSDILLGSEGDLSAFFLSLIGFLSAQSQPLGLAVGLLGRGDVVLRLHRYPLGDGLVIESSRVRFSISTMAPTMAVLTMGAAIDPSLCLTAISLASTVATRNLGA